MGQSGKTIGYRPRGKVAVWMDKAEQLHMNRNAIIQEALERSEKFVASKIEEHREQLKKALAQ